jgi:hypothetical protein
MAPPVLSCRRTCVGWGFGLRQAQLTTSSSMRAERSKLICLRYGLYCKIRV